MQKWNKEKGIRIIAIIPAYNEENKISKVINKISKNVVNEILVVDDGSTDRTAEEAQAEGATVIKNNKRQGVGFAIRKGIEYAKNYDIIVILAGNDKDNPKEIEKLITPIINENYDFVQGSRYINNTPNLGNMPIYRIIATKFIHPFLFSLLTGKRFTDTTNGFRAFRRSIFNLININHQWLNGYELEPYLLYKAVRLKFKIKEVNVSKVYPNKKTTKMRPIFGWWSILRPLFFLALGIKQ